MKYEIKELNLGGILDHAVKLVKNHFMLLLKISLMVLIPLQLAFLIYLYVSIPQISPESTQAELNEFMAAQGNMMTISVIYSLLLLFIANPLTNAAAITGIAQEYLGRKASAGESMKFALKRFGALLGTNILKGILVALGFLLLIIPGIVLLFKYWFTTHVVMIENKASTGALNRSSSLMKGNMGTAFILGLIIAIIQWLAETVAGLVPPGFPAIAVQTIIQSLMVMFSTVAGVVFYFSSRCKADNFDLQLLANAMGEESDAGTGDTESGVEPSEV